MAEKNKTTAEPQKSPPGSLSSATRDEALERALAGFAAESIVPQGVKGEVRHCAGEGCKVEILPIAHKADGTPIFLGLYCDYHIELTKQAAAEEAAARKKDKQRLILQEQWRDMWGGEESLYHLTKRDELPNLAASSELLALDRKESIYLHGPTGHGKTRTLYLHALAWLREHWECPLLYRAIELRHDIASAARRDESARERLMNRLKFSKLLILDDIGHMASTAAGQEAFLELVEWRFSTGKTLWLTSQLDLNDLGETFSGHTGQAIVRRLGQMCRKIDFTPGAAK